MVVDVEQSENSIIKVPAPGLITFKNPGVGFGSVSSTASDYQYIVDVSGGVTQENRVAIFQNDNKIKAITKGQSIVLYNKSGLCIGGGIIEKRNIPYLGKELHE